MEENNSEFRNVTDEEKEQENRSKNEERSEFYDSLVLSYLFSQNMDMQFRAWSNPGLFFLF